MSPQLTSLEEKVCDQIKAHFMFPCSGPSQLPVPPDVYTGCLTHFHMKSRHFPLKPCTGVMGCCVKGKNYNEEIFLITASDYKGM